MTTPTLETLKAQAEAAYVSRQRLLCAEPDYDKRMAILAGFEPVKYGDLGFSCQMPENRSMYRRRHIRTTCYLNQKRVSDEQARAYLRGETV